jgi:hypothetical protein
MIDSLNINVPLCASLNKKPVEPSLLRLTKESFQVAEREELATRGKSEIFLRFLALLKGRYHLLSQYHGLIMRLALLRLAPVSLSTVETAV